MGRILGPAIAGLLLLVSYTAPFFFFAAGAFIVIIFVSFQDSPPRITFKESHNKLSLFDVKVWPFLIVSAGFGISNAALVQTSSFFFQDVITPASENYIALASIGFMLSALGVLNGQLLIADRLQTSPGSLVKLGVILNFLSLLGYAFSNSLVEVYICLFFYGLGGGMLGPGISSSLSLSVGKEYQGAAGGDLGHLTVLADQTGAHPPPSLHVPTHAITHTSADGRTHSHVSASQDGRGASSVL